MTMMKIGAGRREWRQTGFCFSEGTRRKDSDGELIATFFYPTGGREAVDAAVRAVAGEKVPHNIVLPTLMITTENAMAPAK